MLFVGVASLANAQKNEVTEAKNSYILLAANVSKPLADNLKILHDGLAHTDKAIVHEKSKNMPEAWSYRAMLASRIALIDTLDIANSIANQKIAEEAIEKGTAVDTKGAEKDHFADAKANIDLAVRNRGVIAYRKKDYQAAFDAFNEVIKRNPNDTLMYVNAGVMAKELKNYPEVVKNFKKAIELNHAESYGLYTDAITTTLSQLKDTTAALTLIQDAATKYPDSVTFIGFQTDIYMKKGDEAKSQEFLNKLIEKSPTNAAYRIIMGDVFFKKATDLQDKRNKVDTKNKKEFADLGTQMMSQLDKATPYYKAALEIDPKNADALDKLKSIYFFKDDKTNLAAIQKQIDALK